MRATRVLTITVALLILSVAAGSTAAAQDVDQQIQFDEPVIAGEETTIVYHATVRNPTVETTVDAEFEVNVDGEAVADRSYSMDMYDGVEIREEFPHTFDSPGEHEVEVTVTFSVFGQSRTASHTETLEVRSPPAVGGSFELTPDEPATVDVDSTVGGVTIGELTLRSDAETTVFLEFEDEDASIGPEGSLRVVRVDIEGSNVIGLDVSYESEAEAGLRAYYDGSWTADAVDVEGDAHAGVATVDDPGESIRMAFVDVSPEEDEEEPDEDEEDEGLPGFTVLAALGALLGLGMAAALRMR